jgi:dihydroorotate dehydrogenase (fumarate)
MNLATRYLGLDLPHPLIVGASPIVTYLDLVRRAEDAGAAALVMHSLFEEQVSREQAATLHHMESPEESSPEAVTYFPHYDDFPLGPERYLEQLRRIKESIRIPLIGSLNGVKPGGWLEYAKLIEQAGADALELNLYFLPTSLNESAATVEKREIEIVRTVCSGVNIPVSVKLSPFYTSFSHFAAELIEAGAKGLVVFNRFYQPDINIDDLEITPRLQLSDSSELLLRLRWLALLRGRVEASLACTGGVHSSTDVVKALMAGADGVQLVSVLLQHGPERLTAILDGLKTWLTEHEYESLDDLRGCMSFQKCPDQQALERVNYMKILDSWRL